MDKVSSGATCVPWSPASAFRRPGRFLVLCLGALLGICSLTTIARGQDARPTESQVKAAYLFNFGKFVSRQSDQAATTDSFEICILGKDPFGQILDSTVAGESISGKKIAVGRISKVQDATGCSVLFISSDEESRLAQILSAAQRLNLLTVSDIPHFAERGGMIGLVMQQDKVRFVVNRSAADQAHVSLSSELLKVATKVIEKGAPGS